MVIGGGHEADWTDVHRARVPRGDGQFWGQVLTSLQALLASYELWCGLYPPEEGHLVLICLSRGDSSF